MEPLKSACMALMMMTMTMTSVVASDQVNTSGHQPLTADGRIADILNHPAFAGFASLILPWDGRDYDETMWLGEIGALLPYHSHVAGRRDWGAEPPDRGRERRQGRLLRCLHRGPKRADPSKRHTGLFFLRGRRERPSR